MSTLKTNNIQHVDRSDPSIIINTDGSVNIAGTMTYEDVTNVDAVGIITGRSLINAQKQVHVGTGVSVKAGGLNVTAGISTFGGDVQANKITNTGGDTDTFINFPSADTFKVSQNGNDTFHINSSGKVSINTTDTTGAYNLVVTAQGGSDTGMTFRGGTSSQQYIYFADGTSGGAESIGHIEYNHADNSLNIHTNGSEALRIGSDGKVGVNTTAGAARLTVDTSSGYSIIANGNSNAIALGSNGIILFGNKNAQAYGSGGYDATEHIFKASGSEKVRIGSSGQIGIAGANYGTSGQVLTSGGSSGAVSWSTITGTTINTNADNRIITGSGTANTLNGESELTFTSGVLKNVGAGYRYNQVGSTNAGGASIILDGDSNGDASGSDYAYILHDTSGDLNIVATNPADNSKMRFYTGSGAEAMRLDSSGRLSLGNNLSQTTDALRISGTGDVGIRLVADSDNTGEDDNPYLIMCQDGSTTTGLHIGLEANAGTTFPTSVGNSPFIYANNSASQPLYLVHMQSMMVGISNRHNELGLNNYSGCATAGMEIQHRGNDTGAALKLTGHNNTGTPGVETFTQLTHLGSNLTFEILHAGGRAIHIGSTRRIRLPGIVGVSGSGLVTVQVESDGNLCTQSSLRAHKINISSISDNSWLYNLNPVTFNWRTKTEVDGENVWGDTADNNGTQYGLIAEEVKEVKDDFCYYNNNGDLSGVHYDRMIAPLIKAVQDLKKEKDALETRIAALEGS